MRVTSGGFRRRFVYNWAAGVQQVRRVMRNGVQIWPGGEERVRRIALDMSALDGTHDALYWQHALSAVETGCSAVCYIGFEIAERPYRVDSTCDGIALARYELGVLDFGDNGPALADVRVGDVLELRAVVPERRPFAAASPAGKDGGSVLRWGLPWIKGSYAEGKVTKGRKRVSAHLRVRLWSEVDEEERVHVDGTVQCHGHGRGTWKWKGVATGKGTRWKLYAGDDSEFIGQRSLSGRFWSPNSTPGTMQLVFPAFERVFRFPVLSVEV